MKPKKKNNWLYCDLDGTRIFSQEVFLAKESDGSEWKECTTAEKEQWEKNNE